MATLQKFKFLARQCAVASSPIRRSPSASPVVHLRRRKLLRMLLGSGRSSNSSSGRSYSRRFLRRDESSSTELHHRTKQENRSAEDKDRHQQQQQQQITVRYKLKDLFVSSPPPPPPCPSIGNKNDRKVYEKDEIVKPLLPTTSCKAIEGGGLVVARKTGAAGQIRPLTATLRQRLLRRAWRPVLVAIPEQSPEIHQVQ